MIGALFAIASSALWGTADFFGGSVSRRLPVPTVMLVTQSASLVALAVVVPAVGGLRAPGAYLGWGVAFGLVGALALAAFYLALATGTMGIVAPIAATGVIIPVLVGLADGDSPAPHQFAGMALAVAGIIAASIAPEAAGDSTGPRSALQLRSIALAVVAAVGFGTAMVLIDRGGRTSVGMTLLAARGTSVLALSAAVLFRGGERGRWRGDIGLLVAVGLLDVSANGAIAFGQQRGALSVIAVLGSLYPIVTVVLARYLHAERLSRIQAAGVTAALAGVVLTAAT